MIQFKIKIKTNQNEIILIIKKNDTTAILMAHKINTIEKEAYKIGLIEIY